MLEQRAPTSWLNAHFTIFVHFALSKSFLLRSLSLTHLRCFPSCDTASVWAFLTLFFNYYPVYDDANKKYT